MATYMEAKSFSEFNEIIKSSTGNVVVVHFAAPWAPQCSQMNEVLQELAKDTQFVNMKFITLNAEDIPEASQKFRIEAVPTFVFLKNLKEIDRFNGVNAPELTKLVKKHAAASAGIAPSSKTASSEPIEERLKKLVNSSPIMVFMKGQPDEPKCKFSRALMEIFKEQNVSKFGHFDILEDNEVREGLKKYSNWPTYPQVYTNGELLGGLDIIKEMVESNEFKDALPKQQSLEDRLKELIHKDKVMLFMKGNPDQPKCGFSKKVIEIMSGTGVKYSTFDILEDQEVRQGLKTFSNWPTFPQLYVKGELVGGLDIIQELKDADELQSTLENGS